LVGDAGCHSEVTSQDEIVSYPTDTPMLRGVAPAEQMPGILAHIASQILFGCVGESDDVAKAALFWPLMTAASSMASSPLSMAAWRRSNRHAPSGSRSAFSTWTPSALFHGRPISSYQTRAGGGAIGPLIGNNL
jgi:hypothetical protein